MKKGRRLRRWEDDREAGLSLEWRLPRGSFGRMVLGVSVATVLFAGAASVLHVRVPFGPLPTREAAQVVALGEEDAASRELLDWARFHSPFPDRWEPSGTGLLEERMGDIDRRLAASCAYQPRLLPFVEREDREALPGLVELEPFLLPPVGSGRAGPVPVDLPARVDAVAEARGPLQGRWGSLRQPWGGPEEATLVGREATFTVGVTPAGEVTFCLVLNGVGATLNEQLRTWIAAQDVAPDPAAADLAIDVVRVRFEAAGEEAPD